MPLIDIRHYFCATLCTFALSAAASAADPEAQIAACARIASVGDRILCLENALREASGVAIPRPPANADRKAADPTVVSEANEKPPVPADMATNAPAAASTMASLTLVNETGNAADVTAARMPEDLGAEQVANKGSAADQVEVRVNANIKRVDLVGTGRIRFTLDNGQIWQQTGDDDDRIYQRIRGEAATPVEMWQSRSGGYRMHVPSIDRTVRVRRLK